MCGDWECWSCKAMRSMLAHTGVVPPWGGCAMLSTKGWEFWSCLGARPSEAHGGTMTNSWLNVASKDGNTCCGTTEQESTRFPTHTCGPLRHHRAREHASSPAHVWPLSTLRHCTRPQMVADGKGCCTLPHVSLVAPSVMEVLLDPRLSLCPTAVHVFLCDGH